MELIMFGMNYKKTSIEVREKFSFTTRKIISITKDLLKIGIEEVVILSTCNRTEFYLGINESEYEKKLESFRKFFKKEFELNLEESFDIKRNKKMVRHIFEVASGIDSLVLGEDQILGQVKKAHTLAMEIGSSKKILNKLFLTAITIAKKLKTKYKISEKPLSISYIGVSFLEEKVDDFKDKKIMLIGLGETGKLVLKNLISRDFKKLYMSNRSHDKVIDLLKISEKITPFAYEDRYKYLKDVDILITATGSPHTIIKYDKVKKFKKDLTLLDIALPRDIDPQINNLEGFELYNIDDLKEISLKNQEKRKDLSIKMIDEIHQHATSYMQWKTTVKADYLIRDLNNQLQIIKKDTLEVIYHKSDLSAKEKGVVDQLVYSALKKTIRKPILNLKSMTCEEELEDYVLKMRHLFDL